MAAQMSRAGKLKYGPQIHGDRAEYIYVTLKHLVTEAYQTQGYQVNCPDWFTKDYYDVFAKMPPGSTKEDSRLMLAIAAGGSLQAGSALGTPGGTGGRAGRCQRRREIEGVPRRGARRPDGVETESPANGTNSISGMYGSAAVRFNVDAPNSMVRMEGRNMTVRDLVRFLTVADLGNGRPIVDMTGLKGSHDISLDIPMSMIGGPPPEAGAGHPADTVADPPENGRMMQSLKSLGLELKKTKAPVDHLIVDHSERKPTEN